MLQETAELRRSEILDGADASVVAAAEEFIQDERGTCESAFSVRVH